jgi:hypothetical protein
MVDTVDSSLYHLYQGQPPLSGSTPSIRVNPFYQGQPVTPSIRVDISSKICMLREYFRSLLQGTLAHFDTLEIRIYWHFIYTLQSIPKKQQILLHNNSPMITIVVVIMVVGFAVLFFLSELKRVALQVGWQRSMSQAGVVI